MSIRQQNKGGVLAFALADSRADSDDPVLQSLVVPGRSLMSDSARPPFPLL